MTDPHDLPDEPPPFLGAWPKVYVFVLIYLASVIGIFYWFTRHFAT
jgi:hypothetical protein